MSYREVIRGLSIKYLSKKEMELLNRILTQKYKNTNISGSIDNDNRDRSSYKRKKIEINVRNGRMGHPEIATIVTAYASLRCILMHRNLSGNGLPRSEQFPSEIDG